MPASRALTFWATLSTGRTVAFAGCWKFASSPMSWRFEALILCAVEGIVGLREPTPEELASELAPEDWVCHAAGEGAKGPRLYDWARIRRPWTSKAASSIGFWSAASDRHPQKKPTT